MTKQVFFMSGPKGKTPGGIQPEETVKGTFDELGIPAADTVQELRQTIRPEFLDSSLRDTLKITVELVNENDYLS